MEVECDPLKRSSDTEEIGGWKKRLRQSDDAIVTTFMNKPDKNKSLPSQTNIIPVDVEDCNSQVDLVRNVSNLVNDMNSQFKTILDEEIISTDTLENISSDNADGSNMGFLNFIHSLVKELKKPKAKSNISSKKQVVYDAKITNIVCMTKVGCTIDLEKLTVACRTAEYQVDKFPAVILRIRDPRASIHVFKSGKILSLGTTNENDAKSSVIKCVKILSRIGFPVKPSKIIIINVVGVCVFKFLTGFNQIAKHLKRGYLSEIPPNALRYKIKDSKVTAFLHSTGKIVLMGAKSVKEFNDAIKILYSILESGGIVR